MLCLAPQRRFHNYGQIRDFEGLSAHSTLYQSGHFFIFLGADPEFSHLFLAADNPENILLNRKLVLSTLNLIFHLDTKRIEDLNKFREMWAQEVWKNLQLMNRLCPQIPKDVFEDIEIQAEVLEMDPDFSFYKTVFEEEATPFPSLSTMRSLHVQTQEHSSTG
jgi:hypothetical protein